jgi:hypothetical protein
MGDSIIEKFVSSKEFNPPVFPLCIGIYNKTTGMGPGVILDYNRIWDEWNKNPYSVLMIRQMTFTLAKILPSIKPGKVLWAHIVHSEGGMIASEVFSKQTYFPSQYDYQMENFIRNHVITLAFGAVAPVSDSVVKKAINVYSREDVTIRYILRYLDKEFLPDHFEDEALIDWSLNAKVKNNFYKSREFDQIYNERKAAIDFSRYICEYPHKSTKNGHTVTIVKSLVPKHKQHLIAGDHGFQDKSYQTALLDTLSQIHESYKIYDCR